MHQVYGHLTRLISPLQTVSINPVMADLLVDDDVLVTVEEHLQSSQPEVKPSKTH